MNSSLKRSCFLLSSVLPLSQNIRKKFQSASAIKVSLQSSDCSRSHSAFISGRTQSSGSFSARARCNESLSISNPSNSFTSQNLMKKMQRRSNICCFLFWRMKNTTMIGSLHSICASASSTSYSELFTWSSLLNSLILKVASV